MPWTVLLPEDRELLTNKFAVTKEPGPTSITATSHYGDAAGISRPGCRRPLRETHLKIHKGALDSERQ